MSYNGTVFCRHYGEKGHYKRTCPHLTETLKQRALSEINNGEGYDGYWGRQYNKRVRKEGLYADGTKMPAEVKAATKQKRRCKYCNGVGHNRRTCPVLKRDKAAWVEREVAFRHKLVAAAKEFGIGIGTLLKTERWSETHAWMVIGINDHAITEHGLSGQGFLKCKRLGSAGEHRYNGVDNISYPKMGELNDNSWSRVEILAPIAAERVRFPANFCAPSSLDDLAKSHFADARSADWYDNC